MPGKSFIMANKEINIGYRLFDLPHGYEREDREAMLGWFDLHLKGTGDGLPRNEKHFEQVQEKKLLVFPAGGRDTNVITTEEYCRVRGNELRSGYLNSGSFDVGQKKKELTEILRLRRKLAINEVFQYSPSDGWDRLALESDDKRILPILLLSPADELLGYVIICNPDGKKNIPLSLIDDYKKTGVGIVIADLSGTGELTSSNSISYDRTGKLHTLSRAELWLGKTILGEWIRELDLVTEYLNVNCHAAKVSFDGTGESGLAGLFYAAEGGKFESVTLRNSPVSYLFDNRENVDYFSMGIHLPGILKWGDVSLAAALSGKNITFISPVTMSGNPLGPERLKEYQAEFDKIGKLCSRKSITTLL